jgi:hypothetical protein
MALRKRWVGTHFTPAQEIRVLRIGLALYGWLAVGPLVEAAEPSFPRGPGFYYHPLKLICLLLAYFCWLACCSWVNRDVRDVGIDSSVPGALMAGVRLSALVILWLVPWFWLGLMIFLMLFAATTLLYVYFRNQKASPDDRVLTEDHLRDLDRKSVV